MTYQLIKGMTKAEYDAHAERLEAIASALEIACDALPSGSDALEFLGEALAAIGNAQDCIRSKTYGKYPSIEHINHVNNGGTLSFHDYYDKA